MSGWPTRLLILVLAGCLPACGNGRRVEQLEAEIAELREQDHARQEKVNTLTMEIAELAADRKITGEELKGLRDWVRAEIGIFEKKIGEGRKEISETKIAVVKDRAMEKAEELRMVQALLRGDKGEALSGLGFCGNTPEIEGLQRIAEREDEIAVNEKRLQNLRALEERIEPVSKGAGNSKKIR